MPAKHNPSQYQRKLVGRYTAAGTRQDAIAKIIGVSKKTLKKHYGDELKTATDIANGLVAGALFSNAMSGNVTAQIFWLKTRARWRETDNNVTVVAEKISSITYVGENASYSE